MKKKNIICTDYNGKGFTTHKWMYRSCECPNCDVGEHKECYRCGQIKS